MVFPAAEEQAVTEFSRLIKLLKSGDRLPENWPTLSAAEEKTLLLEFIATARAGQFQSSKMRNLNVLEVLTILRESKGGEQAVILSLKYLSKIKGSAELQAFAEFQIESRVLPSTSKVVAKALNILDLKFGISLARLKCSAQAKLDAFAVILSTNEQKVAECRLLKSFLMGFVQNANANGINLENLKEVIKSARIDIELYLLTAYLQAVDKSEFIRKAEVCRFADVKTRDKVHLLLMSLPEGLSKTTLEQWAREHPNFLVSQKAAQKLGKTAVHILHFSGPQQYQHSALILDKAATDKLLIPKTGLLAKRHLTQIVVGQLG